MRNNNNLGNNNTSLEERAYLDIKSKIMYRKIKPGTNLTVGQLTKELGISRTPVREAMRRLEYENILISNGSRGWKVIGLLLTDIIQIFDAKIAMECMLIKNAALSQNKNKKAKLLKALKLMQEKAKTNDPEQWWPTDVLLHDAIFDLYPNIYIQNVINNLNDQMHRALLGLMNIEGRLQRSTVEHEAIVKHIIDGNSLAAEQDMRNHLEVARDELINLITNFVLPFTDTGV